MKHLVGIVLLAILMAGMSSCSETTIHKPDKLIPKTKFIKMMVDVYLVQGMELSQHKDSTMQKLTQTDLYFSVLKKYEVPDTVFIRSLIYYSSFPKEYEKMHQQIMDILKEAETQFKPKDKLNPENEGTK